ncbi:glycosyl transferase, partial [Streptomyces sp. A73]|nr:glycosyl transferase [Streptomyces sp. A73]
MKALHIVTLHTPTHDFGGPTRVALNLCRGLRAKGERDVEGGGAQRVAGRRVEEVPYLGQQLGAGRLVPVEEEDPVD